MYTIYFSPQTIHQYTIIYSYLFVTSTLSFLIACAHLIMLWSISQSWKRSDKSSIQLKLLFRMLTVSFIYLCMFCYGVVYSLILLTHLIQNEIFMEKCNISIYPSPVLFHPIVHSISARHLFFQIWPTCCHKFKNKSVGSFACTSQIEHVLIYQYI